MFAFEKFIAYQKSKDLYKQIYDKFLHRKSIEFRLRDQLNKASTSILLNLSEGSGKISAAEKRRFYETARGSLNEVVSVFDILKIQRIMSDADFQNLYSLGTEIGKILSALINAKSEQIKNSSTKN